MKDRSSQVSDKEISAYSEGESSLVRGVAFVLELRDDAEEGIHF